MSLNIDKYGQQKGILPEGNDLLLGDDILEVLGGPANDMYIKKTIIDQSIRRIPRELIIM